MTLRLHGTLTALITPFHNGEIDEGALRAVIDFQLANGVAGLVPCGTTGETPSLSEHEQQRVIELTLNQVAGRVPVIAGAGTNDTAHTIARMRAVRALGVDAALLVTPYYNKPTQEGLYRHFAAVAETVDLPIVLYNVPGRTGVNLLPETVVRLAGIPSIVAIKEASGNLDQVSRIVAETPEAFTVLSGDDSLTLPIMSVGGRGVVSVVANIAPAAMARLTAAALAGDVATARAMHQRLFALCRAMFLETNPIAVKTAASLLGLCTPELRLPLTPMSEANQRQLETVLAASGLVQPIAA